MSINTLGIRRFIIRRLVIRRLIILVTTAFAGICVATAFARFCDGVSLSPADLRLSTFQSESTSSVVLGVRMYRNSKVNGNKKGSGKSHKQFMEYTKSYRKVLIKQILYFVNQQKEANEEAALIEKLLCKSPLELNTMLQQKRGDYHLSSIEVVKYLKDLVPLAKQILRDDTAFCGYLAENDAQALGEKCHHTPPILGESHRETKNYHPQTSTVPKNVHNCPQNVSVQIREAFLQKFMKLVQQGKADAKTFAIRGDASKIDGFLARIDEGYFDVLGRVLGQEFVKGELEELKAIGRTALEIVLEFIVGIYSGI